MAQPLDAVSKDVSLLGGVPAGKRRTPVPLGGRSAARVCGAEACDGDRLSISSLTAHQHVTNIVPRAKRSKAVGPPSPFKCHCHAANIAGDPVKPRAAATYARARIGWPRPTTSTVRADKLDSTTQLDSRSRCVSAPGDHRLLVVRR